FGDEVEAISETLSGLPNDERVKYRNENAAAIAHDNASHLLVVAGPGAGKSFLFLEPIRHWLANHDSPQIYVSSFVRKLVNDLRNDIELRIGDDGKRQVE